MDLKNGAASGPVQVVPIRVAEAAVLAKWFPPLATVSLGFVILADIFFYGQPARWTVGGFGLLLMLTVFPTNNGWVILSVTTAPSEARVTVTSIKGIRFSPFPPLNVATICGSIALLLLATSTATPQLGGSVCVGPGVESVVTTGAAVVAGGSVVGTAVGAGVATGCAGCVQPAAQRRSATKMALPKMSRIFIHYS